MTERERALFVALLKQSGLADYIQELDALACVGQSPAGTKKMRDAGNKFAVWLGENAPKPGREP